MKKAQIRAELREGDQFIGINTVADAPNEFIRTLILAAIDDGECASMPDAQGCMVTATIL